MMFLEWAHWMQWIQRQASVHFWDVPYADSLLAGDTSEGAQPVPNRNHVWFVCSDADKKGLCFHHPMPAELFSALIVCCFSSPAFPPWGIFCEGWFDWQLRNATVEWGASQPTVDVFSSTLLRKWSPGSVRHATRMGFLVYLHLELCLWGSSYSFIPEVRLLNSGIHPL